MTQPVVATADDLSAGAPLPSVDELVALIVAQPDPALCREALGGALAAAQPTAGLTAELAARLKMEADRHWLIDAHISLRLAEAIIALGELASETCIVALGTMARADALRQLGEPRAALALLDTAAELFQQCGDEVGWARTRISRMGALMVLGLLDEALAIPAEARPVLVAHGEMLRVARLDLNAASLHEQLGQPAAALERYAAVAAACRALGTTEAADLLVMTRVNQAVSLTRQGRLSEALSALHEARTLSARGGETLLVAKIDINIGFVSMLQGRYGPALRALEDARSAFKTLSMPAEAADVACDLLDCYLAIRRPDRALSLAAPLIDHLDQRGLTLQRMEVALRQAAAFQQMGQPAAALASLEALEAGPATRVPEVIRARFALGRGRALVALGTPEGAAAARAEIDTALSIFRTLGLPVEAAQANLLDAQALAAAGLAGAARDGAARALDAALALDLPWLVASGHALLATQEAAAGNLAAAAGGFGQAIAALERMQQHMTIEMRRSFLSADHEAIYRSAMTVALHRQQPEEVHDLVERAKSRALLEHVVGETDRWPRPDDTAGQALAARLAAVREEYQVWCAALAGPPSAQAAALLPAAAPDALVARITRCEEQMHELIEALQLRNPAYDDEAALRGVQTLDPRPYLESGHLILSYYALDDDLLIVALDRTGLSTICLRSAWPAVGTDLRLLRLNLDRVVAAVSGGAARALLPGLEKNARGLLRRLWDRLIAPVAHMLERATRVTIAPYGQLHYLPFHALYDGHRYLVQQVPVSVAPSVSLLAALHRRANRRAASRRGQGATHPANLVVGTTLEGQLPHVATELGAIAGHIGGRLLLDEQATRAAVLAGMGGASVIHLASHGWLHPTNALFSFLQLADGRLSTSDIMELDLSCALVTLSACETGRGHLGGGDDLVGFSRAFLEAGADALVLSLWRVEDQSTARLMAALYSGLAAGRPKDEALRLAQLALLSETGEAAGPSTAHPYFWAPFVLVGDHRALEVGEQ